MYLKKTRLLTFTNLLTNVNKEVDLLTWYCRSSPGAEVDLTLYQVKSIVDGKSIKKQPGKVTKIQTNMDMVTNITISRLLIL